VHVTHTLARTANANNLEIFAVHPGYQSLYKFCTNIKANDIPVVFFA
jgi:hypothetical protein